MIILIFSLPSLIAQDYDIVDTFYFPFIVDGVFVDEIEVGLNTYYEPQYLHTLQLYTFLSQRVKDSFIHILLDYEWISLEQLRNMGLPVVYDEMMLEIKLTVPPEAAIPGSFSMIRPPTGRFGVLVEPLDFSFHTNIYSSFTYDTDLGTNPLLLESLLLEPNLQFHNWVIESRLPFSYNGKNELTLSSNWNIRAVTYLEDTNSRITIDNSQFTGNERVSTVLFERKRSIGTAPRSNTSYELSFLLDEPTLLKLRLNGRDLFSQRLSQGEHSFSGFTLNPGVNELEYITETAGKEPVKKVVLLPFDPVLIPKREAEYSFGLSLQSFDTFASEPLDSLRLFGSVKAGITHSLSSSYYFDISSESQKHGMLFNLATLHGSYSINNRITFDGLEIDDYLSSISYRVFDRISNRSFGVTGQLDTGTSSLSINFSYSQSLFPNLGFSTNFGVGYFWNTSEAQFKSSVSSALRHRLRISRTFSLNTDISVSDWSANDFAFRISSFLSVNFAGNTVSSTARHTTERKYIEEDEKFVTTPTTNISTTYRPDRNSNFGPVSLSLSDFNYDNMTPGNIGFSGSYANDYLLARFEQNVLIGDELRYRAGLRINTAVAFADNTFAVTRPIANSFILIKPGVALQGVALGINPRSGSYTATTSNIFNTAVVPNIPAFSETSLIIEPIDPPDDLYFSESQFQFRTRYKQAAVIRPGADFRLMLTGRLFYREGEPLVFIAGDLTRIDKHDGEDEFKEFFFTDETGLLYAFDLTSGEYYMNIYLRDRIETLHLVIPEGVRGTATISDIYLSESDVPSVQVEESGLIHLTGRLVFDDMSPAALLNGELRRDGISIPFITGENGYFSVYDVETGSYELHIQTSSNGDFIQIYISENLRGSVTVEEIMISDVISIRETTEIITSVSLVTGQLLLPDDSPLSHINLDFISEESGEKSYTVFTDSRGQFSLSNVIHGSYILGVPLDGSYTYYRVIIPEESQSPLTLGTILLPGREQEVETFVPVIQQ